MSICDLFKRERVPYEVVMHLDGRHPYLKDTSLDYETRDITLVVPARDWNDAAEQAFNATSKLPDAWSYSVKSISRFEK